MHKRLVSFIKYNKVLLALYRFFGNLFARILKTFVKTNPKRILFMSFGGQKYDDSPKAIYEEVLTDPYFSSYELIWGFTEPEKYSLVTCKKVKVDTFRFYLTAVSAHIWITNSSVERGLSIKKKDCLEINTWHGTPLKKMGKDIESEEGYSSSSTKANTPTIYCAQSEYDREIFTRLFSTAKENIMLSDLPRNDSLLQYQPEQIIAIKEKMHLPQDKKVILYAPTFREFSRDKFNACYIKPPIDLAKWREQLGDRYVVLFRAHYEVVNVLGIENDDFICNMSAYPCLNDLIAVSDLLISDYSSIYFDYAITGKPMLCFAYDREEYQEKRGLYLDLDEIMPCRVNLNEDQLIDELLQFDWREYSARTKAFCRRFAPYAGNATDTVIQKLKELIARK